MPTDAKKQLFTSAGMIAAGIVFLSAPEHFVGTRFEPFINTVKHPAEIVGYLLIAFPLIYYFCKAVLKDAWECFLNEPAERLVSDVSRHLQNVAESVNSYTSKQLPFDELEKQFIEARYGAHSFEEKQSLYHYVTENVLKPFCKTPHRSMMEKRIDVREGKTLGHFDWHEETRFKIHHPFYSNGNGFSIFPLYWSSSIMSAYADRHKISITVDGAEQAVGLPLDRKPERNDRGFFKYSDSEWTTYCINKQITVHKEYIPVFIEEDALSCIDDNVFTATINEPTYGYTLIMTLPRGYVFKDTAECGVMQLFNGLKERINTPTNCDDVCTVTARENRLTIEAKGWLLPGIVFNVRWQEKALD